MIAAHPNSDDGIFTSAQLFERGVGDRKRATMIRDGDLVRLRNGWFAARNADVDRARAVRVGGRLTGSSALRQFGLWVMPDTRLHVSVESNASRLRSPDDRSKPLGTRTDVCLHWAHSRLDTPTDSAVDGVKDSLAQLIRCADRESAIATLDSAVNGTSAGRALIRLDDAIEIVRSLPKKYADYPRLIEPKAQSGLETLARLRLRSQGIRLRSQVEIPHVGYVDLLIGDRLVVELDSRTHHLGDGYEKDRKRDLELFRQGFVVIRVSYDRVMRDWNSVEESILAAIRRGEHLHRGVHRRLGLATINPQT